MNSIYCAVRTESLYKIDTVRLQRVKTIRYWSLPLRSWKTQTHPFDIIVIILVLLSCYLGQVMYLCCNIGHKLIFDYIIPKNVNFQLC